MRVRAQCIIHWGRRLRMVQEADSHGTHWCLPGGGAEEGETPEDAALRELWDECGVRGQVHREVAHLYFESGERYHTFLPDPVLLQHLLRLVPCCEVPQVFPPSAAK
jgi:8-oxo-dGTP diphosphatase